MRPTTVTRQAPSRERHRDFSKDYPPTLTAHDIGVKDLLDAFYMQSGEREVALYAISINPKQPISMELSPACVKAREEAVRRIYEELNGSAKG
jgi:hydrogenase maturation protease